MAQKRKPPNHGYTWWYYLLPPGILSLITTIFYYPSLNYPFLFDDLPNITKNYDIRHFNPKGLFFANVRWLSRMLNQYTYHYWEFNPFAYRLIDLIIHIAIGTLIFTLVLFLCKRSKHIALLHQNPLLFATITSGLFLLHPVQTQTVTYITQLRLEGLVVLFTISTILVFLAAVSTTLLWLKMALYATCGMLVMFAAGTKEIIVVMPILLGLVDWFFIAQGDGRAFLKRLPIHLLLMVILYKTYLWLGSPVLPVDALTLKISHHNNRGNILTQTPEELITPFKYLIGQFRVILHYITMFFWPFGITFDYGWKIPPSFWSASCIFPLLTLLSILFTGLILFIKNRVNMISFSIAWFFAAVLPRSTIVPSTEFVCDYKTYLPSFGILFFIAYGLTLLAIWAKQFLPTLKNRKYDPYWRTAKPFVLSTFFFVALGFASQQRNSVWSSRTVFWGDVIEKTEPHTSARAYNNYAVGLVNIGQPEKSVEFYQKSMITDPTYAEPVINLALHYQIKKDFNNAFKLYQKAIKMREAHPEMYNNLGLLHLEKKAYDKAEWAFKMALKLRQHYSRAHFGLGQVCQLQNKYDEAIQHYERALQGDYQTLNFYYTHGLLCFMQKKYHKATKSLEMVERFKKDHKKTRFMLATAYYYAGQYNKSLPYYAAIQHKYPNNPSCCYNYGQALLHAEKYDVALAMFMRCKGAGKRFPHTPFHIVKCLHHLGKNEEAKKGLVTLIKNTSNPSLKQIGIDLMKEITTS